MTDLGSIISYIREVNQSSQIIPLHPPFFKGREKEYVINAIDTLSVSASGTYLNDFETLLAKITHTKKSVAVVNGTSAIQVSLRVAGVRPNDEVLTQALTFVATVNAIIYNNAHPVFLDVDLDTMGLSCKAVAHFLAENAEIREEGCYNKKTGRRISACIPMHTFGFPVHLEELLALCNLWKIPMVEDASESLGSKYKEKSTGGFGALGVFSFNGNKIVTAGGGGAIVTNHEQMADRSKHLITTARAPHPFEYYYEEVGYNFRMPNINAALALAQLEQLESFIEKKRYLAQIYIDYFKTKGICFRTETPNTKANYWLYALELNNKTDRDLFLKETNSSGVTTRPIWQLMYKLPMFSHYYRDQQKNAQFLEDRIVNIPSGIIQ